MVFGTFDLLHPGHEFFINFAREQGNELVVVVGRDVNVRSFKKVLVHSEVFRRDALKSRFKDLKVILGDRRNPMRAVLKYRPEIVCLGYDQVGYSERLCREFPDIIIRRARAYFPEKYKSSKQIVF